MFLLDSLLVGDLLADLLAERLSYLLVFLVVCLVVFLVVVLVVVLVVFLVVCLVVFLLGAYPLDSPVFYLLLGDLVLVFCLRLFLFLERLCSSLVLDSFSSVLVSSLLQKRQSSVGVWRL